MAKKKLINLSDMLLAFDKKDRKWYSRLSDEQKKEFSSWIMLRYASSAQGSTALDHIYLTNEVVNLHYTDTYPHPELQWLLLTVCGSGKKQFHPWIKPPTSLKKTDKVTNFLNEVFPLAKHDDIELIQQINNTAQLKQLAMDKGYSDKEIKEIFGK